MFSYVDIDARRAARVEAEASENMGGNLEKRRPSTLTLFPEAEKSPLWQKWNTSKGDVSAVSAMYEVGLKARIEAERLRLSSAKAERVHASPVPLENTPLPMRLNSEFAAEESEAAKSESGKGKSLSPTRALWKALGGSTLQTSPIRSTSQDKRDRSVSSVSTANSTASTTRGGIWKDVDSVRGGSAPGSVESVSSGQSRRPGYPRPVPGSVESVSSGQSRLPGYSRPLKNTRTPGSLLLTTGSAGSKRTASTSVVTTSGGNVVRVLVLPQQQPSSISRAPSARMMVEASPTVSGGLGPITPKLASTDMSHISSISSISSMASGSSRLSRSATGISAPNSGTGDNNDSSHRYSDSYCFDASHLVTYSGVSPTISVSDSVPASASAPASAAPSPLPLVSELELVHEQDEEVRQQEERQQEERQQKYGRDRAITSASHLAVDAAAWVEVDSPMPAAESPSSESESASVSVSVSVSVSAVSEAFLLGADGERHADNNGVERLQLEPELEQELEQEQELELEQEQEQEQQTSVSTPVRPSTSRAAAQSTLGFTRALLLRSLLLAALAAFIAFVPVPPHHKPLLALMPPPPAIIVGKAVLLVDNVRLVSGRFVREAQARSLLPSDATINVALLQLQQHRQNVVAGSSRGLVMVVNTLSSAATQSVCVWNHHTQLSALPALPALPAMPLMPSMFLLPTVHHFWSRTRTGVAAFSESVLSTVSCAGCALSEMWTQSQAMAKVHSYPSLPQLALLSTLAAPVATPVAITTSKNAIANVAPATTATPLPAAEAAMTKASLYTFSSAPAASVKTTTSTSKAPADPDALGLVPVTDSTSIPLLFGMTYSAFGFVVLAVGAALVVASAAVLANLPEETLERIIEMSPVPMRRFLSPRLTRSMAKSAVKARLQRGPTPADASAGSGAESRPRRNLPRKRLY